VQQPSARRTWTGTEPSVYERHTGMMLGELELESPIGVGCWSWGNTAFWNDSWSPSDAANAEGAFKCVLTFLPLRLE